MGDSKFIKTTEVGQSTFVNRMNGLLFTGWIGNASKWYLYAEKYAEKFYRK